MIRNNERQYKSKKREEEREKKEMEEERERGRGIALTDNVKQVYCEPSILTFR